MVWSLQSLPDLSEQQYADWSKLLEERTGIQLADQQRSFLQTQISIRMRELNLKDYSEYYAAVTDPLRGIMEWSVLVDRLVVKETSFFRHRPSIDFVRNFLQTKIDNRTLNDSFELWSVGCATGEEPYSLAITINDCFELAVLEPYWGITATDISSQALAKGREGIFPARKMEQLTKDERSRYFESVDDYTVKINGVLSDRVCFTHGNLLSVDQMPSVKMDVIFCQNVLIYFRRWRRRKILNALVDRLKPGGVLIIGLGEIVDWTHPQIHRVDDDGIQAYLRNEQ